MYTCRHTPGLLVDVHSSVHTWTTSWCTPGLPVDVHRSTHTWTTSWCIPIWLPVDVHLDYLLMDSCRCTRGLLDVQLSGYLSMHIYETACSCTCMRPPVNSHPQDTTLVAPRLQCESKKLHQFYFCNKFVNQGSFITIFGRFIAE